MEESNKKCNMVSKKFLIFCDDAISKSETKIVIDALEIFDFLLGIVIWYDN